MQHVVMIKDNKYLILEIIIKIKYNPQNEMF